MVNYTGFKCSVFSWKPFSLLSCECETRSSVPRYHRVPWSRRLPLRAGPAGFPACGGALRRCPPRVQPQITFLCPYLVGKHLRQATTQAKRYSFSPSSSYSFNGFPMPKYKHHLTSDLQILSFVIWKHKSGSQTSARIRITWRVC